jgi:hypothetical protein
MSFLVFGLVMKHIVLFCPIRPLPLKPHDHKVPSVLVANEKWITTTLIELHDVPGICTGDENCVVVFCPSRPKLP